MGGARAIEPVDLSERGGQPNRPSEGTRVSYPRPWEINSLRVSEAAPTGRDSFPEDTRGPPVGTARLEMQAGCIRPGGWSVHPRIAGGQKNLSFLNQKTLKERRL
jgi:hypothetical protein